jgi:hypothetical protein
MPNPYNPERQTNKTFLKLNIPSTHTMENQKPTHSLHNDKFKNIGIDTSFIEKNATEYNDKIAPLYNGGKKEATDINDIINRSSNVRTVNTPVGQRVEPVVQKQEEQQMESQSQNSQPKTIDLQQLEQMMDNKVLGLATKMQQYANETDDTIKNLKQQVFALEQKVAKFQQPPAQNAQPQQTLASSGVQTPAAEEKKSTLEEDVAIDKMFNFSNNASGNRQK